MGVVRVDELREMAREVVPDADDQEERDIALGKFGSFNRSCLHTYYWLPALERSLEGIKSYMSRNEMSAAPMARHETTTVGSLSRTRKHSGDATTTGSSAINRGGRHYIRVLCKSVVSESFQVNSHHLPAPPRLDYSFPLPSSIDAAYPFAARLDSVNAEAGPSTAAVRHVTPDEGFTTTLLNLDSEFGVHADVFWRMFRLCHSCNHIMTGNVIEDHICILN